MQDIQATLSVELPKKILEILKKGRARSKTIILATGVFDILHSEHELFLKKAASLGDIFIIGIESDFRVKQIKGVGRPINSQEERVSSLINLNITDNIFVLPNQFSKPEDHINLIKKIEPDVLAVSSHTNHLDKKRKIMSMVGGELVVVHAHNPGVSSSKIIDENA